MKTIISVKLTVRVTSNTNDDYKMFLVEDFTFKMFYPKILYKKL